MPGRLPHACAHRGIEPQHDLRLGLVRDDVPGPPQRGTERAGLRGIEGARRQREVDDPLHLERSQGIARLVVPDQVQGVGRQRRLEQVGAHLGPAGLAFGPVVARRRVPEAHDPPLRPRPREVLHVAVEGLVHASRGEVVEGALDVLAQGVRQSLLELLERRGEVRLVLVGIARHQPRRQEDRHRLGERQAQRRQERPGLDTPTAALAPDRELQLALEGAQVAVDGPLRHPRATGDLGRPDPGLAARLEDAEHRQQPGEAVSLALRAIALARVVRVERRVLAGVPVGHVRHLRSAVTGWAGRR